MRGVVVVVAACSTAPAVQAPRPDPCVAAYATYEQRWSAARSEELLEVGFDVPTLDEMVASEIATLPTRDDLVKLRTQYAAVSLFLPDAPWPRALDAAEVAIDACGEAARKP